MPTGIMTELIYKVKQATFFSVIWLVEDDVTSHKKKILVCAFALLTLHVKATFVRNSRHLVKYEEILASTRRKK